MLLASIMMSAAFYAKLAQFHALGFNSTRAQAQAIAEVTGQSPTRIYQVLLFIRDQEDILQLMDQTIDTLKNA